MALLLHALVYGIQVLAKFVGLTVVSVLSLAVGILINSLALSCTQLLIPIPGFRIMPPGLSPLDLIAKVLELFGF